MSNDRDGATECEPSMHFTLMPEPTARALGEFSDELRANYYYLQRLTALLLAKAGGVVEITARDLLELSDREPTVAIWPIRLDAAMTRRIELIDKDGDAWKLT